MFAICYVILLVVSVQDVALTASLSPQPATACNSVMGAPEENSEGRNLAIVPYIVEITRNFLKFQTFGCDPLEVQLTETESEDIQKLSLEFVKLLDSSKISSQDEAEVLDWKDLNPIIMLTNSEISIRFVKMNPGPEGSSSEEVGKRFIYWKFLTEYAKNIFENKLKELNVTGQSDRPEYSFNEDESTDDASNFQTFLDTLWKIMKISVNYAEDNANGWSKLTPEVTSSKTTTSTAISMTPPTDDESTSPSSTSTEPNLASI